MALIAPDAAAPSWWPADRAMQEAIASSWGPLRLRFVPDWLRRNISAKQEAFLRLDDDEVFFGGAAGPGKSTALLAAALQYVDVPGYAALILRRTLTDLMLPEALISVSHDWLADTPARWNGQSYRWTFPSGATLTFGHMVHDQVMYRYQSSAYQFIGWDELTHFTKEPYRYLFSRCRRPLNLEGRLAASPDGLTVADVPLRVRAASNPGGIGHEWVYERLVNRKTRRPESVFLPALAHTNPGLDLVSYRRMLAELGPVERRQLEEGDWTARRAGEVFDAGWFRIVDLADGYEDEENPLPPPSPITRVVRVWDLAGTRPTSDNPNPDYTATLLGGIRKDGRIEVLHGRRFRKAGGDVEDELRATARADGRKVPIRIEQEPGSSGKTWIASMTRGVLAGYAVRGVPSSGDKEVRALPAASMAQHGNILVHAGAWLHDFLDEADAFPHGGHDDYVDCLSSLVDELTRVRRPARSAGRPQRRLPRG